MKTIIVDLNKQFPKLKNVKEIEVVVIGDAHIGDPLFDEEKFLQAIKYIKDKENCFCILNGDLINNATKISKSDIYSEMMPPKQQIDKLVKYLSPISSKIIAMANGNHEGRTYRETGMDIGEYIATKLGLENIYSNEEIYMFLYFGDKYRGREAPMCYTAYITHGDSGGSSPGAKLNKVISLSNITLADLYIMNHLHEAIGTEVDYFVPEFGNKCLIQRKMKFFLANSFLKYGGYGAKKGFRPLCNDFKIITFNGTKRNIKIEI